MGKFKQEVGWESGRDAAVGCRKRDGRYYTPYAEGDGQTRLTGIWIKRGT